MAKSRQRIKEQKIIDNHTLKKPIRFLLEEGTTVFLWIIWIYFVSPILTMFLWLLGVKYFYEALFPSGGLKELIFVLKNAALFMSIIFCINIVWVYYNWRFIFMRLGERRKSISKCQDSDFDKFLVNDSKVLPEARKRSRLHITLESGRFLIHLP
jgi:poly-beta-1,6-N-acetyl-D-glucosamine biosynthesis protein PgaD